MISQQQRQGQFWKFGIIEDQPHIKYFCLFRCRPTNGRLVTWEKMQTCSVGPPLLHRALHHCLSSDQRKAISSIHNKLDRFAGHQVNLISIYFVQPVRRSGEIFTYTLQRVDGDAPGVNQPRDLGIFATSPNWLYKIDADQINLFRWASAFASGLAPLFEQ